jgi:hypothetical protein
MEKPTSKSAPNAKLPVIHLLSTTTGHPTQHAEDTRSSAAFSLNWETRSVETVTLKTRQANVAEVAPMAPPYVHDFARQVATIKGVTGVIAETGDDQMSVHITTFAIGLTEEIRTEIYKLESTTILGNPHVAFDFHLRRQEELSGSPAPIAGKYYYAIWGFADVNKGSTSQAGSR